MEFHNKEGFILFDGEFVPWRNAKIHLLTHGLHYASCVFEGERVYNGKVFKLKEHSQRLIYSAQTLGLDLAYDYRQIMAATKDIIKKQNIKDGYVRPIAWRGSEAMGISAVNTSCHFAIACWPWPSYFSEEIKRRGLRLAVASWRRPPPQSMPVKTKAAGLYMICTLSRHEAEKKGFDDALMLDCQDNIAESTGANIFFVIDKQLHTPDPYCFLDGITRRTVLELAHKKGIKTFSRRIKLPELEKAQEAFITGTAVEVTPVSQIEQYKFKIGDITRQLMDDYQGLISRL